MSSGPWRRLHRLSAACSARDWAPYAWMLFASLSAGCTPPHEPTRAVALTRGALTGGSALDTVAAEQAGLVTIVANGGSGATTCAGSLITRRWLLTASSCLCAQDETQLQNVIISQGAGTELVSTHATRIVRHPTLDVALVRVADLLPLRAPISLWDDTRAMLAGKTLRCYGHGSADAFFDASVSAVASTGTAYGSEDNRCGGGGNNEGLELAMPAGVMLDSRDRGAPCFVTRGSETLLAGMLADDGLSVPKAHVNTIEQLRQFIHDSTDVWTRAACERDVPGSQFALDPTILTGVPDANTLTLVADHAFNTPDEARLILAQSSDAHLDSWQAIDPPVLDREVRALSASADRRGLSTTGSLLMLAYLDERHDQRLFWYDPSIADYVTRDELLAEVDLDYLDGEGVLVSNAAPRVGLDVAGALPLFAARSGALGTSDFVRSKASADELAFRDMFAPELPPGGLDPRKRPSFVHDPSTGLYLASAIAANGDVIAVHASAECFGASDYATPFCDSGYVAFDLPTGDVRDLALGLDRGGARPVLVTTNAHGTMSLHALDEVSGHARMLGSLGARSLTIPKLATFAANGGDEELFVAYTAANWFARVQPVGNCLGNSPPQVE